MPQRRKPPRAQRKNGPCAPARGTAVTSSLVGASLGLAACGFAGRFAQVLDDRSSLPARLAIGGLLGGLALGVVLPGPAASWAVRLVTALRDRFDPEPKLPKPHGRKAAAPQRRALLWLVTSVVALLAGLLVTLAPLGVHAAERIYRYGMTHFVWMSTPLLVFRALMVMPLVCTAGALTGLTVHCVHRLACPSAGWRPEPIAWTVIAAGLACVLAARAHGHAQWTTACLIGAGLPLFILAALGVIAANRIDRGGRRQPPCIELPPEHGDRMRAAMWLGLAASCLTFVLGVYVWSQSAVAGANRAAIGPGPTAWLLLFAGFGVLLGCRVWRDSPVPATLVGQTAVAAGIGMLAAAWLGHLAARPLEAHPARAGMTLVLGLVATAGNAFALATHVHALLNGSGRRAMGGAHCSGLCLAIAAAVGLLGPSGLAAGSGGAMPLSIAGALLIASGAAMYLKSRDRWLRTAVQTVATARVKAARQPARNGQRSRGTARRKRPALRPQVATSHR